ncbi:MAG: sigma-E processing peptidase SpoIIGA [Clostridia bacterium]|nr:sigma-E processing peptidase SpoIIGA [Clostridia bacterium]
MKIYADILFAINFSMDFISFFITSMIMRRKINKKRILLASAFGGIYGVVDILLNLDTIISIVVSVLSSLIMCLIAYHEKTIRRFIGMYIVHWGISATLGGFMSILYSFLNSVLGKYIENYTYSQVYTGARFFIALALAIIISTVFGRFFSSEKSVKSTTINVVVNKCSYSIEALCDSGNLLTEPISGKAVILINAESDLGRKIEEIPEIFKRFIPYKSVGGNGMIKGIIPEKIEINGSERAGIIAPISKINFAGYEACVPSVLVN